MYYRKCAPVLAHGVVICAVSPRQALSMSKTNFLQDNKLYLILSYRVHGAIVSI